MAEIVVANFVSLDGVIQGPLSADEDRDDGFERGGWVTPLADELMGSFMSETTTGATAMLLGRRSYQIFAAAWSAADPNDPAISAMNTMPKYVATRDGRLPLTWSNSHRIGNGDLPSEVDELTRQLEGRIVVFGSSELASVLAAHDLVDEYRLLVFPLVLGSGKRMFTGDAAAARFKLVSLQPTSTGVALCTYSRP